MRGQPLVQDRITVCGVQILSDLEMGELLGLLKMRLKAELVDGVNMSVILHFDDTHTTYHLHVVYSVLHVQLIDSDDHLRQLQQVDVKLTLSEQLWRLILLQKQSPLVAYATGQLKVDGSLSQLRRFFSFF